MARLRCLCLFAGCVWGPKWSSFCQTSEALQKQPLGVLFHLLSYCSEADMQILCNERSLCFGGGGWGSRERKGGWTYKFKLQKGKVEEKERCRQACLIKEQKNLRGLGEGYVMGIASNKHKVFSLTWNICSLLWWLSSPHCWITDVQMQMVLH